MQGEPGLVQEPPAPVQITDERRVERVRERDAGRDAEERDQRLVVVHAYREHGTGEQERDSEERPDRPPGPLIFGGTEPGLVATSSVHASVMRHQVPDRLP